MSPNYNLTDLFTGSSLEPKFTSRARVPDVRDFVNMKLPNVNPQAASIGERFWAKTAVVALKESLSFVSLMSKSLMCESLMTFHGRFGWEVDIAVGAWKPDLGNKKVKSIGMNVSTVVTDHHQDRDFRCQVLAVEKNRSVKTFWDTRSLLIPVILTVETGLTFTKGGYFYWVSIIFW